MATPRPLWDPRLSLLTLLLHQENQQPHTLQRHWLPPGHSLWPAQQHSLALGPGYEAGYTWIDLVALRAFTLSRGLAIAGMPAEGPWAGVLAGVALDNEGQELRKPVCVQGSLVTGGALPPTPGFIFRYSVLS